jgi:4-hydroxy-tetrahydrodipicolinate reductase
MDKKIKIGLFGFGRTGQVVANEFIKDNHFDLCWVVRKSSKQHFKYASNLLGYEYKKGQIFSISDIDDNFYRENHVNIIIDFSDTKGVYNYIAAADQGIKIISAISQYQLNDLKKLKMLGSKTAVIYSPNITLGINFLIIASQLLKKIVPHADIEIIEEHFKDKSEVSGTALRIAKLLHLKSKMHINSIRVGGIVGKHEIIFGLPNQTIRLVHESINRSAFGQGAIFASKFLIKKKKGLYSMENIIMESFSKNFKYT